MGAGDYFNSTGGKTLIKSCLFIHGDNRKFILYYFTIRHNIIYMRPVLLMVKRINGCYEINDSSKNIKVGGNYAATIVVVPYDEKWAKEFNKIKGKEPVVMEIYQKCGISPWKQQNICI